MKAIGLPLRVDNTGRIAAISGENEVIYQQIVMAVLTQRGERVMRPRYGTLLRHRLFEIIDDVELTDIREDINDVLQQHEPKAVVMEVQVEEHDSFDTQLSLRVKYQISSDLDPADVEQGEAVIDIGGEVSETYA